MKIPPTLLSMLKNKYLLSLAAFLVWMIFFDPRDWSLISARREKLEDLKKSEERLTQQIRDTRKELSLLKTSAETIEKYAREVYHMKKDNEDLFLVNSAENKGEIPKTGQ